jgi:uncharacterized protein
MKKESDSIIYSPSDLIRYLASPFASWLDRYYLENPDAIAPDKQRRNCFPALVTNTSSRF